MRSQRYLTCVFAACLVSLVAGLAIADEGNEYSNASLKGTYRIFSHVSSVGSPAHLYFIGTITYDGHGHARMEDRGTIIDGTPGTVTAPSFDETGEFTYKVKRDGSFTQEGTFTSSPVGSYRITGVKWVGQIGARGSVLILSGAIPPEPQIFESGGIASERLSSFTATAVRIPRE